MCSLTQIMTLPIPKQIATLTLKSTPSTLITKLSRSPLIHMSILRLSLRHVSAGCQHLLRLLKVDSCFLVLQRSVSVHHSRYSVFIWGCGGVDTECREVGGALCNLGNLLIHNLIIIITIIIIMFILSNCTIKYIRRAAPTILNNLWRQKNKGIGDIAPHHLAHLMLLIQLSHSIIPVQVRPSNRHLLTRSRPSAQLLLLHEPDFLLLLGLIPHELLA